MPFDLPHTLSAPLNVIFSEQDHEDFRWLRESPRYYTITKMIGKGRYSEAYLGYPSDREGKPLPSGRDFKAVVKIPLIGSYEKYDGDQIGWRLKGMREQARVEQKHIRNRLRECQYANPTIDLVELPEVLYASSVFDAVGTVQPYLDPASPDSARSINTWLTEKGYTRAGPDDEPLSSEWLRQLGRAQWLEIAMQVAVALRHVHLRRVTHGDVHPGNIFLREGPKIATLIDFGQSFLVTPDQNWSERKLNPFLAPERTGSPFHLNEQVDVYSYGMLLFFLACGNRERIPKYDRIHFPLSQRRVYIKQTIEKVNRDLILQEPKIVDIISLCTALDPCDRLRMVDVVEDLTSLISPETVSSSSLAKDIASSLSEIQKKLMIEATHQNALMMKLLRAEVRKLEYTLESVDVANMVELTGTRKELLRKLVSLFDGLESGDSWTTVTTPSVWQHGALGLGGSYASATIRAVLRGVKVRRTFVVAVEELGLAYSKKLHQKLKSSRDTASIRLAKQLDVAIAEYKLALKKVAKMKEASVAFTTDHGKRFVKVMRSLQSLAEDEGIQHFISREPMADIYRSSNLYLGLHFVSTLAESSAIRATNPASLIHLAKEKDESKSWTLVVTDIRGRIEDPQEKVSQPMLLYALRVFKSVLGGIPRDRINSMKELMKNSVNVGPGITELVRLVEAAAGGRFDG